MHRSTPQRSIGIRRESLRFRCIPQMEGFGLNSPNANARSPQGKHLFSIEVKR